MKSIQINKSELIKLIGDSAEHYADNSWAIYFDYETEYSDGAALDVRHNTYPSDNWCEMINLQDLYLEDESGNFVDEEGYDSVGVAEWIVSNLDHDSLVFDIYDDLTVQLEIVEF